MEQDVLAEKRRLRRLLQARAAALPEQARQSWSAALCARVLALPEWRAAGTIFCFLGVGPEPDTRPLRAAAAREGKRVALPRCEGHGRMHARLDPGPDGLVPGALGIPEPGPDCPIVPPEELGLILVPCVSCTRAGARLGHGAGYYDRYLAQTAAPAAILCFEAMLSPELPEQAHDLRPGMVITEAFVYRKETFVCK